MRVRGVIRVCACALLVAAAGSVAVAASADRQAEGSAGALVVTKGHAVKQVAIGAGRLAWETGPLEGITDTTLSVRARGRRGHVLARNVKASYGLAIAAGWVVYAEGGARTRLSAIRPDGSHRIVLSRWLAAPFAARGRLVAWVEQDGRQQKLVVRNMSTGRVRLVYAPPRCRRGHCYQIEQIMLAGRGLVFTRDSSNPDLSWVKRIRFSTRRLSGVRIRHDPQPNLVHSSAGALYYVVRRGWYRWDFGGRPRRTRFRANPPAPLLGYERGRWLLSTREGCDFGVVALTSAGRRTVVASPRRIKRLVRSRSELCVVLQAAAWVGGTPLTAWAIVNPEESEEHSDKGLFGLGLAGKLAR